LVTPSLYFARPAKLNDPFDCQLDIVKSFRRAIANTTGERQTRLQAAMFKDDLLNSYKKQFESVGVCSFSLLDGSLDEPLLWSHYANEHRGVCLLYQFSESFLIDPEKKIIGASIVKYEHDVLTKWLTDSEISPIDANNFVNEITKIFLTAKNPAWKHEKELRILRTLDGNFDIPRGSLEQVCFGLRTPQADIDLITKLAKEYSGCTKFCKVIHADSDFGIEAIVL